MAWRGVAVAAIIAFGSFYVFFFQNPLFIANMNVLPSSNVQPVKVTPFLPSQPRSSGWLLTVLSYSCGGEGPGVVGITNNAGEDMSIVSVSLTYGGKTFSTSGPSCLAAPGITELSITALVGVAGSPGSAYHGYLATADGNEIPFSGTWM